MVLPRKWSKANRTEIRVIALEGSVINKERLDINILNDITTKAPKSDYLSINHYHHHYHHPQ